LAEKKSEQPKRAPRRRRRGGEAPVDLGARLRDLQEELFKLRFQFATRQLTNTARIGQVRREIARVKTRQRQQELAAQAS
jgi:large subunit ribosomal protein L29